MNVNRTKSRAGKVGAQKSHWSRWNPCNFSNAISQDQVAAMAKRDEAVKHKQPGATK